MYTQSSVGQRIMEQREGRGLTRAQLADLMSISVQAVGKWERGESLPDILTFKKLADCFSVKMDSFFLPSVDDCFDECPPPATSQEAQPDQKNYVECEDQSALQEVVEPSVDAALPRWNMSGANWRGCEFVGLSNVLDRFRNSNIHSCNFSRSDLSSITFRNNNIQKNNFSHCELSQSVFSVCNMPKNDFSYSKFAHASIRTSHLSGCNFEGSDLTGAQIRGSAFDKCNMSQAVFFGTQLVNTFFVGAVFDSKIENCSFTGCTFKKTRFENVSFVNTFFKNQSLSKVIFLNCTADPITYALLKNCKAPMSNISIKS